MSEKEITVKKLQKRLSFIFSNVFIEKCTAGSGKYEIFTMVNGSTGRSKVYSNGLKLCDAFIEGLIFMQHNPNQITEYKTGGADNGK